MSDQVRDGRWKRKAGIALIAGLVVLVVSGVICFRHVEGERQKEKQDIARYHLNYIFQQQRAYHERTGKYGKYFEIIDWIPVPEMRVDMKDYTFYMCSDSFSAGRVHALPTDIKADCDNDRFVAVAVGNLDKDPALDVWTINEMKKIKHLINDLEK